VNITKVGERLACEEVVDRKGVYVTVRAAE